MLAEKPDLPDEHFGMVDAFVLLSQGRPLEGGIEGMIPLRDMQAYMEIFGIDDLDERSEFVALIRRMDLAYVTEKMAKRSRNK